MTTCRTSHLAFAPRTTRKRTSPLQKASAGLSEISLKEDSLQMTQAWSMISKAHCPVHLRKPMHQQPNVSGLQPTTGLLEVRRPALMMPAGRVDKKNKLRAPLPRRNPQSSLQLAQRHRHGRARQLTPIRSHNRHRQEWRTSQRNATSEEGPPYRRQWDQGLLRRDKEMRIDHHHVARRIGQPRAWRSRPF